MNYELTINNQKISLPSIEVVLEQPVGSKGRCFKVCQSGLNCWNAIGDKLESKLNPYTMDVIKAVFCGALTFGAYFYTDQPITKWTILAASLSGLGNLTSCIWTPTDNATEEELHNQNEQINNLIRTNKALGITDTPQANVEEKTPGRCFRCCSQIARLTDKLGELLKQRMNRYVYDAIKIFVPTSASFFGGLFTGQSITSTIGLSASLNGLGNCLSTVLCLSVLSEERMLKFQTQTILKLVERQKIINTAFGASNIQNYTVSPLQEYGTDSNCFRCCNKIAKAWNGIGEIIAKRCNLFTIGLIKVILAGGISTASGLVSDQPLSTYLAGCALIQGAANIGSTIFILSNLNLRKRLRQNQQRINTIIEYQKKQLHILSLPPLPSCKT